MIGYGVSGADYDFFCYNAAGQVWNGSAFVSWSDAGYASYRVEANEVGASGRFTATAPSGTVLYELRPRGDTLELTYTVWSDTIEGSFTPDQLAALVAILGIPSSGSTPETPTSGVLADLKNADLGDADGYTLNEAMKIILAVLAGKVSGAGTGTETFEAIDGSKVRISSTVNKSGNRLTITVDAT